MSLNQPMTLDDIADLAGCTAEDVARAAATAGVDLRGETLMHPGLVPLVLHLDAVQWQQAMVDRAIEHADSARRRRGPVAKLHARMTVAPSYPEPLAAVPVHGRPPVPLAQA